MSIKHDLIEEFTNQLGEVGKMEVGTEKYKIAMDGVTKLADRIIEIEKCEAENDIADETRISNELSKSEELRIDKRDRIIRNTIEAVKVIGGFGLTAWAFVAAMNFEKEGVLTTEGGKSALRSLLKFGMK